MSNENDALLPEEDETETQTLNKMVAKIKSMDNRLETVETKVDAQSKQTNANLLNAFAEILRDALTQQKAEFEQTLKDALAQQEIKFEQALAQQEVKFTEMIKTEVNNLRVEMLEEFKLVKREIRNIDRRLSIFNKDIGDVAVDHMILKTEWSK
ncbi:MAG: hypothetical protein IPK14_17975 [Blastocatellia bacterium]|nr:hypothetical protein [Blastocatellia bacterium]